MARPHDFGFAAVITKPYTYSELLEAISQAYYLKKD